MSVEMLLPHIGSMRTLQSQKETAVKAVREICNEAADDLEGALRRLVEFRFRIPPASRLNEAIRQLRAVAALGKYPADTTFRQITVNAINLAHDFADIAAFLPAGGVASCASRLKAAFHGSLRQDEDNRQPYQAQSELWIRSVLTRGTLPLIEPDQARGRSLPDYCVEIGTMRYAVEVKRPEKRSTCLSNLDRARDQLADFGTKGVVVLDLTDVFGMKSASDISAMHDDIESELVNRVWLGNREGYRPGFGGIMLIATVARGIDLRNEGGRSLLSIVNFSATIAFSHYARTLHARHAERLQDTMSRGFAGVGFSEVERETGWGRVLAEVANESRVGP